jgi:uncharacterized protein YbcI
MDQDKLNSISSYTSKLLRRNFGRGPESCQSTVSNGHFVIHIRGFISPMEEVLMEQGQRDQVERARTIIINHIIEELKGVIQVSLEREVEEYYQDWNFPNNTGIIIFVLSETERKEIPEKVMMIKDLESEVARISELVQKVPDKINVYSLSSSIYIVERKGILIPIEKALISKGFANELRITKDELEKKYFHRYGRFSEIFNGGIRDIFIDWNFPADKSLMAVIVT